jgi:hypothetical protein
MFWGNRTTDGYLWMLAQKIGEFDPAKMQQQPAG